MNEPIGYNDILLERIKYGLELVIPQHIVEDMNISNLIDWTTDAIAIQLKGCIWGEKFPPAITIKYPRDWWQAFKERWCAKWILERWPVVHRVHHIDIMAIYPDLKISLPRENHYLKVTQQVDLDPKPIYPNE